jgi:putative ABC transport system ATP-binding protein
MLRVERISKRYDRASGSKVALDDVSIELERGQIMGIFGPSGSGKTTLLRIAACLQQPDTGIVTYNGQRLEEMSAAQRMRFRRREIACVWVTRPWREHLSVFDHVALPLLVDGRRYRSAAWRVREALLACEAERCIDMELHELSDGERERVELARAMASEPRLLLADSPGSSLSLLEQEQMIALLSSFAREAGVAVLVTARDAQTLAGARPVHYLRDGRLIDPEPMSELGKLYRFPQAGQRHAAADA